MGMKELLTIQINGIPVWVYALVLVVGTIGTTLGVVILLPNDFTDRITHDDKRGFAVAAAGLFLILGIGLLAAYTPIAATVTYLWNTLPWWGAAIIVGGVVLLITGLVIQRRH